MFMDEFRWYKRTLEAEEIEMQADDAFGVVSPRFVKLSCASCDRTTAQNNCEEGYHMCYSSELMGGALVTARSLGWIRPSLHVWIKDPVNSPLAPVNATAS